LYFEKKPYFCAAKYFSRKGRNLRKVLKGLADYESSITIISSSRAVVGGRCADQGGIPTDARLTNAQGCDATEAEDRSEAGFKNSSLNVKTHIK